MRYLFVLIWFFWIVGNDGNTHLAGQWVRQEDCTIVQKLYVRVKKTGQHVSPCLNDREILRELLAMQASQS
jgi:hypothetical protein